MVKQETEQNMDWSGAEAVSSTGDRAEPSARRRNQLRMANGLLKIADGREYGEDLTKSRLVLSADSKRAVSDAVRAAFRPLPEFANEAPLAAERATAIVSFSALWFTLICEYFFAFTIE